MEVRDRGWKRILSEAEKLYSGSVKVGVLSDSGSTAGGDLTLVELAVIHEYGTDSTPERSFIRSTLDESRGEYKVLSRHLAKQVIGGKITADQALQAIGAWGSGKIRTKMARGPHIPPPLKQATIDRKGSDRPLVDTGTLMNSVTSQVES